MTMLKDIDTAMVEAVTAEVPLLELITRTGRHPHPDGRERGRRARPWTPGRVYADANGGLAGYGVPGRHAHPDPFAAFGHRLPMPPPASYRCASLILDLEDAGIAATPDDDWRQEAGYL